MRFLAHPGYTRVTPNLAADDIDSDADPVTGDTAVVTIGVGANNLDVDAGLVQSGGGGGEEEHWGESWGQGEELLEGEPPSLLLSGTYKIGNPDRAGAAITDDDTKIVSSDTRVAPGATINATAKQALTDQLVATFTDTDFTRTAAHYTATIDWGDGSAPSVGTVTLVAPGIFTVKGDHTFATPGVFPITVTVTAKYFLHPLLPSAESVVYSRSVVGRLTALLSPVVSTLTGASLSVTLGDPLPATNGQTTLATFVPGDSTGAPTRYSAMAYFDSASPPVRADLVSGAGAGVWAVVIPTTTVYSRPGTYKIRVAVRDTFDTREPGGAVVASADATVTVTPTATGGPLSNVAVTPVAVLEQAQRQGTTVASFTLAESLTGLWAQIDWGDGTPVQDATVVGSGGVGSNRTVTAPSGEYREPGLYTVTVTIGHSGGPLVERGTTARVTDKPVIRSAGAPGIERAPSQTVGAGDFLVSDATSEDNADAAVPAGYLAWVSWGDGSVTAGTVYGSAGKFWLGGGHNYTNRGSYTAVARVWDADSPWDVWTLTVPFTVVDQAQGEDPAAGVVGVVRVESADGLSDQAGWLSRHASVGPFEKADVTWVGSATPVLGVDHYAGPAAYYAVSTRFVADGAAKYSAPVTYSPLAEAVKGASAGAVAWTVNVADAPLSGEVVRQSDLSAAQKVVLTFTDPFPSAPLPPPGSPWTEGHTAKIDFGNGVRIDGTMRVSEADPTKLEVLTSVGTVYTEPGEYQVSVRVDSTEVPAGRAATLLGSFLLRWEGFRAYQRRDERDDATWVAAGPAGEVSVNTGAVRLWHELDFDQSPGTSVGRDPHLVYNTATINPKPVIEAVVPLAGVPRAGNQLRAVLTGLNGQTITRFFPLPADPAPHQVIAIQSENALATGVHDWTLTVTVVTMGDVPVAGLLPWVKSDLAQVVNNTTSPFGPG